MDDKEQQSVTDSEDLLPINKGILPEADEIDYIPEGTPVRINLALADISDEDIKHCSVYRHHASGTKWAVGVAGPRTVGSVYIIPILTQRNPGDYAHARDGKGRWSRITKFSEEIVTCIDLQNASTAAQGFTVPSIACAPIMLKHSIYLPIPEAIRRTTPSRTPLTAPGLPALKEISPIPSLEEWTKRRNESQKAGAYKLRPSRYPREGETPNLIGSLRKGGELHDPDSVHYPCIDLDYGAKLVPSQTAGHYHLYLGRGVRWADYVNVLFALSKAGLIEYGYFATAAVRGMSTLRPPLSHVDEIVRQRLAAGENIHDIITDLDLVVSGSENLPPEPMF